MAGGGGNGWRLRGVAIGCGRVTDRGARGGAGEEGGTSEGHDRNDPSAASEHPRATRRSPPPGS
eukprot:3377150-Pyramimonas_sp.AAC.1